MNDSTRVMRRPRRAWPPAARTAAAIIATAALALLAAACGGSPSSAGSGGSPDGGASASSPSAVAYSSCLRSHGVPNYPDPGGGGLPRGRWRTRASRGTCNGLTGESWLLTGGAIVPRRRLVCP
jgi:hypothetical protein